VHGIQDTLEDFEAQPTVETVRPTFAAHQLVKKLGCYDGYELHLADKPYFGVSRPAIIKTAERRSPGYLLKRRRLVEEARIVTSFRHPSFVSLIDAVEDEHGTHLVFEHVEGTNLRRASAMLRDRNEALPFELCVFILTEVLRGLSYAHVLRDADGSALRLVLRDLVPVNVLVAKTGHVKLATFAFPLVQHTDEPRHPDATAYLAPERISRHRYDARADVYSAGVLLLELLFGRACSAGMPLDQLTKEGVPHELIEAVSHATEMRPEDRYQSASAMARDLLKWLHGTEHHTTPSTVAKFFERQHLFDDGDRVRLAEVLEEDATLEANVPEEPNDTLSALIISEQLEEVIEEIELTPAPIEVPLPAPARPDEPLSMILVPSSLPPELQPERRVRMLGAVLSAMALVLAITAAVLTMT
jgi:serine/threonine-protein kinase